MRPRKKPNLAPRLAACESIVLKDPVSLKGHIRETFPNPQAPLHLEIGCGKGGFVFEMARRNPDINFVAVEREPNVAVIATERVLSAVPPLPNIRFILDDAEKLPQIFLPGELERIYINFCDPWHKHRQFKRRLTYRERLKTYQNLLLPGGEIWFKTDNYNLYHFSLYEFAAAFPAYFTTNNLHQSECAEGNVMTEYETHFSSLGQPIYAIRAKKTAEPGKAPTP